MLFKRFAFTFILVLISCFAALPQGSPEVFLKGANISSIAPYGDEIWFSTYGQGIYRYNTQDSTWKEYSTAQKTSENDFFYNVAANKDYVWAGASEGLFILEKKTGKWKKRKFALGGEMGNWVRSLCFDAKENVLWIGRFKNLTRLDVKAQKFTDIDLTENKDAKTNTVASIRLDGDSLVWFGTEAGVHIFNKKIKDKNAAWSFLNNKEGFKDEGDAVSVRGFLFAPNYIWFATDEFVTQQQPKFNIGGIYTFNRQFDWSRISRENGLPGNGVYCLERTGNIIWAGIYQFNKRDKKEYGKGLVLINRVTGELKKVELNDLNLATSFIFALYFDSENMWVGTDIGLLKIPIANRLAKFTLKKEEPKKEQPKKRKKGKK